MTSNPAAALALPASLLLDFPGSLSLCNVGMAIEADRHSDPPIAFPEAVSAVEHLLIKSILEVAMTAQLLPHPPANLVHNVTWEQLEEIDRSLENIGGVKLIYLDGTLEIMPIGEDHEDAKATMRLLLENYLRARGIRFYSRGGPTLGRKDQKVRNEPDESFNIGTRKQYPDLVFEVVVTSGGVNRLEGYRRLGVSEVWYWEDGVLTIYRLREQGYEQISNTELVEDFPLALFTRYITYHDQFDAVDEFLAAALNTDI